MTIWGFVGVVATSAVLVATDAHAQANPGAKQVGFEGGVRTGYGLPLGKAVGGAARNINSVVAGIVPLWFEVGHRVAPSWMLGAFFQYGLGIASQSCEALGVDCSSSSIRLGAQVHVHLAPTAPIGPWLGYGAGYEWFDLTASDSTGASSALVAGFEFANLQAGLDLYPSPSSYLGFFFSVSIDQFNTIDGDSIDNKSLHNWLLFGIRGGFTEFTRRPRRATEPPEDGEDVRYRP